MDKGHVKQVATFEKLLGFCNANGAMFNPGKEDLKITALTSLLTSAQQSLEAVKTAQTGYIEAVNERNRTFNGLPKLMTRMVNVLAAMGASRQIVEDAYRISKRFQWKSKSKVLTPESASDTNTSSGVVTRSRSYQDFDSKAHNFEELVKLMVSEPSYLANEPELSKVGLQAKAAEVHLVNRAVIAAQVALSMARKKRNEMLYGASGIHGIGMAIKKYVKAVYGFLSPSYRQVRGLRFVNSKLFNAQNM
jgi:hypothetical protein